MESSVGVDTIKVQFETPAINPKLRGGPLVHSSGIEVGKVEVRERCVTVWFCLPKFIRPNNVNPFTAADMGSLNDICDDLRWMLCEFLEDGSECWLRSIEANITMKVLGRSTPNQVLNFIHRSHSDTTNLLYEAPSRRCKYMKEKETVIIRRKNYFVIKAYNKTLEQRNRGNSSVENNLLRIEVVMLDRIVRKLFGLKCDIFEVLQENNLRKVIAEYKRIFTEDLMTKYFTPCINGITQILVDSLMLTGSPAKTLYDYKEIILDVQLFRNALKQWNDSWDTPDSSRQCIYRIKDYHLPMDVIRTIQAFFDCCKSR